MLQKVEKLHINKCDIAFNYIRPRDNKANLFWLGGYMSDMFGSKASFLAEFCAKNGLGLLRFDPSGVGLSNLEQSEDARLSSFLQATLTDWLEQACYLYQKFLSQGNNNIIIGSSCGGWLALLLELMLNSKGIKSSHIMLLAPAPDFTQDLLLNKFTAQDLQKLQQDGYINFIESEDAPSLPFSYNFIQDAKQHFLLTKPIEIYSPVTILQGGRDDIVPPEHSLRLISHLLYCDVNYCYIKDADHGLSREQDLLKLANLIMQYVE